MLFAQVEMHFPVVPGVLAKLPTAESSTIPSRTADEEEEDEEEEDGKCQCT